MSVLSLQICFAGLLTDWFLPKIYRIVKICKKATHKLTFLVDCLYQEVFVKIELKIDEQCSETKIVVVCNKLSTEISDLMKRISKESPQTIIGYKGEFAVPIELSDIIRIYAAVGKVFVVTTKAEYVLHLRLYEAEDKLCQKNFVRISNSEIINIKKVKKFDLSMPGTIYVSMSNGDTSLVSRRYVAKIKDSLGM